MASIKDMGNGTYKIVVSSGFEVIQPPKGSQDPPVKKRVRKITYYKPTATTPGARQREVKKFAANYEAQVHSGQYIDGSGMTFSDFYRVWDEHWASSSKNLTQRVREDYKYMIDKHVVPFLGTKTLDKIKPFDIDEIVEDMEKHDYKPKTIRYMFTSVNSVFSYAYRKSVIESNPCNRVDLPRVTRNAEIHPFTMDQSKRFLSHLQEGYTVYSAPGKRKRVKDKNQSVEISGYKYHKDYPLQEQAFLYAATLEGLRRGELIALTWEDVDFKRRRIDINKAVSKTKEGQIIKDPKTPTSNRVICVTPQVIEMLKELKVQEKKKALSLGSLWTGGRGDNFDKNYVFTRKDSSEMLSVDTPGHWFHKAVRHYNEQLEHNEVLEDEEKKKLMLPEIRLHDLRHTYATIMIANGVDIATISKHLGHASLSVTLDIYTHSTIANDRKAAEKAQQIYFGT